LTGNVINERNVKMNKFKRLLAILLIMSLGMALLSGCQPEDPYVDIGMIHVFFEEGGGVRFQMAVNGQDGRAMFGIDIEEDEEEMAKDAKGVAESLTEEIGTEVQVRVVSTSHDYLLIEFSSANDGETLFPIVGGNLKTSFEELFKNSFDEDVEMFREIFPLEYYTTQDDEIDDDRYEALGKAYYIKIEENIHNQDYYISIPYDIVAVSTELDYYWIDENTIGLEPESEGYIVFEK
jgi:hypothetical protein